MAKMATPPKNPQNRPNLGLNLATFGPKSRKKALQYRFFRHFSPKKPYFHHRIHIFIKKSLKTPNLKKKSKRKPHFNQNIINSIKTRTIINNQSFNENHQKTIDSTILPAEILQKNDPFLTKKHHNHHI